MTKIYVDADACPVKAMEKPPHATKFQYLLSITAAFVLQNPIITTVVVDQGADVTDQWIDHCGTGDIVITSDIPLAARAIEHGSLVVNPMVKF